MVAHMSPEVLEVLYCQLYLRPPTSQSQKLNSVQTLFSRNFKNYKCKQQKLQFWKEPVLVRGKSSPSGGNDCHGNVFRGTHTWNSVAEDIFLYSKDKIDTCTHNKLFFKLFLTTEIFWFDLTYICLGFHVVSITNHLILRQPS